MPFTEFRLFVLSLLFCWILPASAHSQTLNVQVRISSLSPSRINIETELPTPRDVFSFHNTYAGIIGLGERIENVEGFSTSGDHVAVRALAPGEFRANAQISRFAYDVKLDSPPRGSDMSHVSWLQAENGLLMMADLLPQAAGNTYVSILFELPTGWHVASAIPEDRDHRFSTTEPEKAVFLVTPSLHEESKRLGSTDFAIAAQNC